MARLSRSSLIPLAALKLIAAVLAALAAIAGWSAFEPRLALAQTPPSSQSCPLPLGQQIRAVNGFAEMLPVFRHPRCSNCHGGMDVLSARHPGADQLDPSLNPRTLPMTPDFRAKFEKTCQDCHDGLPGWTVTPPPLFFVDKDDEQLCMQMKGFGNDTGAKFVSHIHDDHGGIQFIAAGFAGDRALGDGLKDYGLVIAKPPGTQPELTAKARKWVAAMGGNWVGDLACGCVMPKIEGSFTQIDSAPLSSGLGSGADAQKVTGKVTFAPADGDPPAAPSFGDVKSSFFHATAGTITFDIDTYFDGLAGSRCTNRGTKSFAISDLPQRLRRYLWLELADDGRYKLSLGLTDRIWQMWKMEVESVCTFPTGHVVREQLPVNQIALMLGVHQGKLSADDEIVGRLAAPIRQGPRSINGHWSFARKPLP